MLVWLSVNSVICYSNRASLLWFSDPSEIVSELSSQMYYTVTKLGFTGVVTTELTCEFPLTLLPFSSAHRFALCRRCSLDHSSTEVPLVPSALFCMATRPFSSSAMEMSPGAAQLLVMCPESLAMMERCWGGAAILAVWLRGMGVSGTMEKQIVCVLMIVIHH